MTLNSCKLLFFFNRCFYVTGSLNDIRGSHSKAPTEPSYFVVTPLLDALMLELICSSLEVSTSFFKWMYIII